MVFFNYFTTTLSINYIWYNLLFDQLQLAGNAYGIMKSNKQISKKKSLKPLFHLWNAPLKLIQSYTKWCKHQNGMLWLPPTTFWFDSKSATRFTITQLRKITVQSSVIINVAMPVVTLPSLQCVQNVAKWEMLPTDICLLDPLRSRV